MKKQIALGRAVAARAAQDKSFGQRLDKMKHDSPGRLRAAKSKVKKRASR